MSPEPPIACTLSATALPERRAEIAALGRAALVDVDATPRRAELRFAPRAGLRERVDALAAAESRCCAFLTLAVTQERGAVVLRIEAPAGAELVLHELVAAFGAAA